jgi:hypothetical protein
MITAPASLVKTITGSDREIFLSSASIAIVTTVCHLPEEAINSTVSGE